MRKNSISAVRGKTGEDAVCEYLEKHNYKIIKRNYRKRCGEIDIVAENDEYIAFVEVKTRKFNSMASGGEAITPTKKRRIVQTADLYLTEFGFDKQPRFDFADVVVTTDKFPEVLELQYYENDFDATGIDTWN